MPAHQPPNTANAAVCCGHKLASEWTIRTLTSTTVMLRSVTQQLSRAECSSRAWRSRPVCGSVRAFQFGIRDT